MSPLNLHLIEEIQSDIVVAVQRWCAEYGCEITSDHGKKAIALAVRLPHSSDDDIEGLLAALTQEMAATALPHCVDTILILEDEPFILMDMEDVLQNAGFSVKAYTSRTEAMKWLTFNTPSAAILDFELKDGASTDIALLLQTRGAPIIVCSAMDRNDLPSCFSETSWILKPFLDRHLVDTVRQAMGLEDLRHEAPKYA